MDSVATTRFKLLQRIRERLRLLAHGERMHILFFPLGYVMLQLLFKEQPLVYSLDISQDRMKIYMDDFTTYGSKFEEASKFKERFKEV